MTSPSAEVVRYVSAGGVIVHEGRILVLDRPSRDEVRLPKGHVEPGETAEAAAVRETTEESGYADVEVVTDLGTQDVTFTYKGRRVHRREHCFLMRLGSPRTIARSAKDQRQFRAMWVVAGEALSLLTFEAERTWVRRALAALDARATPPD